MMSLPATMLYYVGYDTIRAALLNKGISNNNASWISGGFARGVACVTVSPLERIRTQLQANASKGTALDVLRANFQTGALWQGLSATVLRDVPFSAIYWFGYETNKEILGSYWWRWRSAYYSSPLTTKLANQQPPVFVSFLSGLGAGWLATVCTHPFDVIKTQMQTAEDRGVLRPTLRGTYTAIQQKAGWLGFSSGLRERMLKVGPACAIMITCYEGGKRFFGHYRA
eukprot:TRINITY_DN67091_c5_g6_i1.p1 TRINITY_DN67091_c5_g6~~TRINITY_DN67091_c5_g6_i1.p1  ORF type:complete len:227 (+),score=21.26 TRINITY_DN67091_c5_g6_i1:268-948(+)